jgi:pilus assembly protein CpaB
MNTKPKERILMVAILLGVAAAAMIWTVLRSSQETPANAQTQVVTASSNITSGEEFTRAKLSIRSFPNKLVPPGAATDLTQVLGQKAKTNIKAGQPIFIKSLRTAGEQLTDLVPRGMRAVTVGLDPVIGVGGFLKPGNRVDVVASFEMNGTSYARTVLQNVSLLAIGEQSEEGNNVSTDKTTSRAQPTATLAVSPNDAEKLILADAKGKLRLALRSSEDGSISPRKPVSTQAVLGVAQKNPTATRPAPPAGNPTFNQRFDDGRTDQTGPLPPMQIALPAGKTVVMVKGTTVSETFFPSDPAEDPKGVVCGGVR